MRRHGEGQEGHESEREMRDMGDRTGGPREKVSRLLKIRDLCARRSVVTAMRSIIAALGCRCRRSPPGSRCWAGRRTASRRRPTEAFRVPSGMVEHTVTLQVVAGGHEAAAAPPLRAVAGRVTAATSSSPTSASGRVIAETTATGGEIRTYEPELEHPHRRVPSRRCRSPRRPTRRRRSATALESGRTHQIGERNVRGRDALVVRSREGTVTVVRRRDLPSCYERRTALAGTVQTETRTTELLPAGSPRARLTMRPHPGAKVVRTS